jgi:hypothetical protein
VLFNLVDTSVGYQPPNADPNDDGLNFMGRIGVGDVIEVPITFSGEEGAGGTDPVSNAIAGYGIRATFKLKSMTREFSTDYEVQVTDLKIPTGYDLEAT